MECCFFLREDNYVKVTPLTNLAYVVLFLSYAISVYLSLFAQFSLLMSVFSCQKPAAATVRKRKKKVKTLKKKCLKLKPLI